MNCIVRGRFRNERNINEREWGEKRKKYTTSKGRSRHADFRGAIDQENVKKRGGGVEKAALLPKIPLPHQMGPPVPVCYPVPISPFEIGRFFEPFFPTRHLFRLLLFLASFRLETCICFLRLRHLEAALL